ncbi:6319_t:CDS:2 [Scutellospora calospora]|uniref:6319_t:CDS:1 n=1 Tax=Scutellospora calospora TaxID=85575 RepID=A0ACA9K9J8_9GLOM|nr:6319_t:CDS:2 [Scutellospora calospora]
MSDVLKEQFTTEWLLDHEGKTKDIRVRDIDIARELLEYLDNGKDMNYKKMYNSKKLCISIIHYGSKFINMITVQTIINKGGVVSRYFLQKLHLSFEGEELYGTELYLKGNDMELFHFLSSGPYIINEASDVIKNNFKDIERLVNDFKFGPFPPRIGSGNEGINEIFPSHDGFENNQQINVIARCILLDVRFVKLWKEIGYFDICKDINDLVLQGAMLILFPPSGSSNWILDKNRIVERFKELIVPLLWENPFEFQYENNKTNSLIH